MYYYNGSRCIYCNRETDLVDSITVHQENHGLIYYCKECQAWCGTIHGDQSIGCVAKKGLREARKECHHLINKIIEKKVAVSKKPLTERAARTRFYKWLSATLDIDRTECHVAYFAEERCKLVIDELKKYV